MTLPETMNMPLDEVLEEPGNESEVGRDNKVGVSLEMGYVNSNGIEREETGENGLPDVKSKHGNDKVVNSELEKVKRIDLKLHEIGNSEETGDESTVWCNNPTDVLSDEQKENRNGEQDVPQEEMITKF